MGANHIFKDLSPRTQQVAAAIKQNMERFLALQSEALDSKTLHLADIQDHVNHNRMHLLPKQCEGSLIDIWLQRQKQS